MEGNTNKTVVLTPSDSAQQGITIGSPTDYASAQSQSLKNQLYADKQKAERSYLNSNLFNRWYRQIRLKNMNKRYKEIATNW